MDSATLPTISDPIIWRCLSYRNLSQGLSGIQTQVVFDDLVATEKLADYFKYIETRVDKVTVKRLGPQSWVIEHISDALRVGAKRLSHEKKNHKLEDFFQTTLRLSHDS